MINHDITEIYQHVIKNGCKIPHTDIVSVPYLYNSPYQRMICKSKKCSPPLKVTWPMEEIPISSCFYQVELIDNGYLIDKDRGFILLIRVGQCTNCGTAYYALMRKRNYTVDHIQAYYEALKINKIKKIN